MVGLTRWLLRDFDVGAGESARAFEGATEGADWIDVAAPGDVYLALQAAGRLPDPIGDRTEGDCAWVTDREWWVRTTFEAPQLKPGQRLKLTFEGLDTLATIWLNGDVVGHSENMFVALVIDITALAKSGANRLAVRFSPTSVVPLDKDVPVWPIGGATIAASRRNQFRKAQFGWGWDWGPTLPTVGIWKPVTLAVEETATLRTVKFATEELTENRERARVSVAIEAEVIAADAALSAEITLTAPDGEKAAAQTIALTHGKGQVEFDLHHPELWWTPELGKAALHTLTVTLKSAGKTLDQSTQRVGVRTIAIDTSPDPDEAPAHFFRFVLNGVSLFARGACWIPASSFVAEVDEAHYRRLLEPAVRGNMNMLRIWGGGVYEHAAFYEICDQLGLLIWQDFMFACAPYPEHDPAFVKSVDAEIRFQIERLRNHPCIALWCGNNENQVFQATANHVNKRNDPTPGDLYYEKMMPAAVAALDPTTPYWAGSPYGGPHPNSMLEGDVHDWTVWHGVPPAPRDKPVGKYSITPESVAYTRYAEDMARFVSEYGIQASPAMETLRRAMPADQRVLGSPGLLHRLKDRPTNKVDAMMIPVTGLPTTLDQYVDLTQITQSEGLKFGIEHFRRRTPHCAGSLIWQYNDCWPAISWSLVDYYGFGKASYFVVARAYAPLMASFKPAADGDMELWIVNDRMTPVAGTATMALHAFAGGTTWSESVDYEIPPTTSRRVWKGEIAGSPAHVLSVRGSDDAFPANRHFFAPIKDLDRDDPPAPQVRFEQRGPHEIAVHITAKTWLWFVHLLVADERTVFSDNYVDVAEGETRVLTVRNEAATLTPDAIEVRWR